ncbi:polysaccharide biosynthesis/export family protein [Chitinophaga nivalis]|uniref:Polysaccharide biosynthesis/export family protein n=1 Tax=Chitinophaga nivalis TaxID=2991709 RepID=A0ABT3IF60_9BACT|nr:polysaccharide biosynthesis/export family protein [Chitinophaga nivalis]MCW3467869.1 polysaccharide biosynthesis/export family protein [Chitinophaga nivalis]MCW3482440.1 polysaccharide biosynthesis/export family protein [Chitinophaga nivalis]
MGSRNYLPILLLLVVIFTGCSSTRKLTYFNDIAKITGTDSVNRPSQLKVQPGDILQITITTIDKDVSLLFNPNIGSTTTAGNNIEQGYLVDSSGNITLPVIGKVYVKDKTTTTITSEVAAELAKNIRNAYVSTRLINFRVSVLGDVARPGSYKVTAERATLLDALSMAGDLNTTARRDDIMIIRETDGIKTYTSLNLNDSKTLSSPYYYLSNNDVIYIKPGPNRPFATSRTIQLLPAILSLISLATTIIILSK